MLGGLKIVLLFFWIALIFLACKQLRDLAWAGGLGQSLQPCPQGSSVLGSSLVLCLGHPSPWRTSGKPLIPRSSLRLLQEALLVPSNEAPAPPLSSPSAPVQTTGGWGWLDLGDSRKALQCPTLGCCWGSMWTPGSSCSLLLHTGGPGRPAPTLIPTCTGKLRLGGRLGLAGPE